MIRIPPSTCCLLTGCALWLGAAACYGAPSQNERAHLSRIWQEEFGASLTSAARPTRSSTPSSLLNYTPDIHRRPNQPHPAVARVIVPEQGATSYGSGTLIDVRDNFGLVITNWHVVRDAQGPVEVLFPGGFTSKARAVKVDADWDLAALVIWRPAVQPVTIAVAPPRPGDELTICGYGQGMYRALSGRCIQYYAPRQDFPQQMVELDVEARQGDSGGPIFNYRGELAGVLFGAGQGTTLGSFGGRVDTFLATLAPDIGLLAEGAPQSRDGELGATGEMLPLSGACIAVAGPKSIGHEVGLSDGQPGAGQDQAIAEETTSEVAGSSNWSASAPGASNDFPSAPQVRTGDTADWQAVAPSSLFEQTKTVLAAVGLLAIAVQVLRAAR